MLLSVPKLNKNQLDKLSDISSDVGLVALASVVLPAVLDRIDIVKVLLGSVATIFFWLFSVRLRK